MTSYHCNTNNGSSDIIYCFGLCKHVNDWYFAIDIDCGHHKTSLPSAVIDQGRKGNFVITVGFEWLWE